MTHVLLPIPQVHVYVLLLLHIQGNWEVWNLVSGLAAVVQFALKKFLYTYTFYTLEEYLTHSWIMCYTTRFLIIVVYWFTILSVGIQLVVMDYF